VFGPEGVGAREFTSGMAGTYTLMIEGRIWDGSAPSPYEFTLHRPQDGSAVIDLGTSIAGPFAVDGKVDGGLVFTGREHLQTADQRSTFAVTSPSNSG
jgi:hypothetical protein